MASWQPPGSGDPFGPLYREMGRILQSFEATSWRTGPGFPALNLYDCGNHYQIVAELPGVAADELDVSITGETLVLRGERRRAEGVRDDQYRRQERPFGRWSRTISLPERIDGGAVTAESLHGVLTIRLPKSEQSLTRQITVAAPAQERGPMKGDE